MGAKFSNADEVEELPELRPAEELIAKLDHIAFMVNTVNDQNRR